MEVKLVYSSRDPVGLTIKRLGYAIEEIQEEPIDFQYNLGDVIVVLCRHTSSRGIPSLTVHHPGNPTEATLGGRPRELGIAYPSLASHIFRSILTLPLEVEKTLEATHHGPTDIRKPVIFVEVGSSEREWTNERLVKATVDRVLQSLDSFLPQCEAVAVGLGGGHYAPSFNRLTIKGLCFGHIISKHSMNGISEEVLRQAVKKSIERVEMAILDNLNRSLKEKVVKAIAETGVEVLEQEKLGEGFKVRRF
jgi:D-aminoacyl-tRNA deacylase